MESYCEDTTGGKRKKNKEIKRENKDFFQETSENTKTNWMYNDLKLPHVARSGRWGLTENAN